MATDGDGDGTGSPGQGGVQPAAATPGWPPPLDPWLAAARPVSPAVKAIAVGVARYRPTASQGSRYQALDCLWCEEVHAGVGPNPGSATFLYKFDGLDDQAPQTAEEAIYPSSSRPKTVLEDDELVAVAIQPGGASEVIFHGRAVEFAVELDGDTELVRIQAVGIARDATATPIGGALIRDASKPLQRIDVPTDLPAAFNPRGRANATAPKAAGVSTPAWAVGDAPGGAQGDYAYPTFWDPTLAKAPPSGTRWASTWTLPMAARHLIFRHTKADSRIAVPDGAELDDVLVAQEPTGAGIDQDDPATFTRRDIVVPDTPISGRDWPSTLYQLLRDKGFGMAFEVGRADNGYDPATTLRIFRIAAGEVKYLYLQPYGAQYDPTLSNVCRVQVARDTAEVINRWEVVGAPERHELSVTLAALFPMAAFDASSLATLATFDRNAAGVAGKSDAYRMFGFDECGEGHYDPGTSVSKTDVPSLDAILGAPDNGKPRYACRRRPGKGDLISVDGSGKPRRTALFISTNYSGPCPGVWDGTGTWQEVEGGWSLLKDRLGIMLTADNPNRWRIGDTRDTTKPYPDGIVKVIESLAAPNAVNKKFTLRLATVIDADVCVKGVAEPSGNSVLTRTVTRTIDARDRYHRDKVGSTSPYYDESKATGGVVIARDDGPAAKAEAIANRVATENGRLAGEHRLGYFTTAYRIGDRIGGIVGRGISYRTDSEASPANSAVYPTVVGLIHKLFPDQSTTVVVSDEDGHRHSLERRIDNRR